jgi:hypothetical protein
LLLGENPAPDFEKDPIGQVQAYAFGYDWEFGNLQRLAAAFGAQVTAYGVPGALGPVYGSDPVGDAAFFDCAQRAKLALRNSAWFMSFSRATRLYCAITLVPTQ